MFTGEIIFIWGEEEEETSVGECQMRLLGEGSIWRVLDG